MITLNFDSTGGSKTVQYNFNTSGKQCEEKPSFIVPNQDKSWLRVTDNNTSITVEAFTTTTQPRTSDITVKVGDSDVCTDGGDSGPHRKIHIIQSGS